MDFRSLTKKMCPRISSVLEIKKFSLDAELSLSNFRVAGLTRSTERRRNYDGGRQMKNEKASGPDNIPAEALNSRTEVTANMLHVLFKEIWEKGEVPTEWNEGYLIKTLKERNLGKCEKYGQTPYSSLINIFFWDNRSNKMSGYQDDIDDKEQGNIQSSASVLSDISILNIAKALTENDMRVFLLLNIPLTTCINNYEEMRTFNQREAAF
ncbi:unnamed protein product, partial [Schistosoma mattheei]